MLIGSGRLTGLHLWSVGLDMPVTDMYAPQKNKQPSKPRNLDFEEGQP